MRFFIIMLITALASALLLHFLPWWISMVIAFLMVLLLPLRMGPAILSAALGVGLCWLVIALFRDIGNEHILSRQIAVLMGVPSYIFVVCITGLIGFISGALGGFTASALNRILRPGQMAPRTTSNH
jgi:hypothetical protein